MPESGAKAADVVRAAILRGAGLLLLWLVIMGADLADLAAGLLTAAAAAWASLRLLPPGRARLRPAALGRLVLHFLWQSAIAGADVARRALDPSLPLRPGVVICPTRLASGAAQSAFCAIASLLPGTLPAGSDRRGALLVHCLDVEQDVPTQMAEEEARFLAALGRSADDD